MVSVTTASSPVPMLPQPAPRLRRASVGVVESYLPLVWKVARQVASRLPSSVEVEELVGAGTVGLVDAMSRYDESRCDRFEAYAEIRVRGAILDQLREMDWVPRSARAKARRLDDEGRRLQQALGRAPDASELAEALGTTSASVERMRRDVDSAGVVRGQSLDEHAGSREAEPEFLFEQRELRGRLTEALVQLSTRQRHLLDLYYVRQLKLREIGDTLGVSESRVCQLLKEIVARMRLSLLDA